jgi:choline dehydrogenase-like flavoprotein
VIAMTDEQKVTTGGRPVLKVTYPSEIPDVGLTLAADVVVIGSGAGGAVTAYELSRSGAKVVVLEAGPHIPSSEFQEHATTALETLYEDHGNQVNTTGDLPILQGRCVGGSTVVNAAACFRVPDQVLQNWAEEHGLDNLSPVSLAPYFERVERNLSIHQNEPHEVNYNGRLLIEGAKKVGIPAAPISRNIKNCALTGHCISGCKTDRKQSMLVTYLPWASELGATILSGTRADSFEISGRRVTAVNAVSSDASGKQKPIRVEAGLVVVAAGAVQTPLLFQRNKLANSSGQVGRNFACHPSLAVLGEHDKDIYAWVGSTLSAQAGDFQNPLKVLAGSGHGRPGDHQQLDRRRRGPRLRRIHGEQQEAPSRGHADSRSQCGSGVSRRRTETHRVRPRRP